MPQLLTQQQILESLGTLPGWSQESKRITREWKTADFKQALEFINAVGGLAEEEDHHPDILLHGWNHVRITLATHSAGGITDNDVSLARKISEIKQPGGA